MATRYKKHSPYTHRTAAVTGDWGDRHKSSRIKENIWQQQAIGHIENFLHGVNWNDLGGSSKVDALRRQLEAKLNQTRVDVSKTQKAIGGWQSQLSGTKTDLLNQLSGVQTTFSSERASVADAIQAAEAGWADDVAAWNQQGADWTNQFSQQQREHETQLAEYLAEQQGAFESQQAIWGQQSAEDRAAWETESAAQRQQFAEQLEQSGVQSAEEIERLKSVFAQQQEDFRLTAQQERKTLESQLGTQYTEQWERQQQDLTSQYEGLLSQATTDAEVARLEQARDFEQRQLDQQAAWNEQAQQLATQDELYGARLDELKTGLGLQTDMYSRLKEQSAEERSILGQQLGALGTQFTSDLGSLSSRLGSDIGALGSQLGSDISSLGQASEAARSQLGTELGSQISSLGQESEVARSQLGTELGSQISSLGQESEVARTELGSQLGSQISTLGQTSEAARSQLGSELGSQISAIGQIGETEREFLKGDIAQIQSNFDTTTRDATAERNALKDAVKRSQEMAIQAQERTRVAASYGSQGSPTNQQVQGVRTINELTPAGTSGLGTRGAFNRKGLRIRNLNI